jgi:23S rRNA (cytidine1920-2'-O)/16S rRNA (cytidine1409-2'-O)-methyltransferase
MATTRRRLDTELVRRGLVPSRRAAREVIAERRVTVGGAPALKADRRVAPDEPVLVRGDASRYVSRGGDKLAAALAHFAVPVDGARALDVGASTGGFTDCLLQHGAARVVAVDVGRGQLHERLRADRHVELHERTNVRELARGDLGPPFDLVVADLSFISLRTVAVNLVAQCADDGQLVVLVKPQFEAGRHEATRGRGVIRDPAVWRRVLDDVSAAFVQAGAAIMDGVTSPLRGADGNVEFFLHGGLPSDAAAPGAGLDIDGLIAHAAAEAGAAGGSS